MDDVNQDFKTLEKINHEKDSLGNLIIRVHTQDLINGLKSQFSAISSRYYSAPCVSGAFLL